MIATPAADVRGLRHSSFATIAVHAATKIAAVADSPTR